jgi:hypothetical protein
MKGATMSERMSDEDFERVIRAEKTPTCLIAEALRARRCEARGDAVLVEALAVLALVQFSGYAHDCPICHEVPADGQNHSYYYGDREPRELLPGHASDCRLAKVLARR